MHENRKRIPIPDPGDDILTSLEEAFNAAGIIVPYDSVSAQGYAVTLQYVSAL